MTHPQAMLAALATYFLWSIYDITIKFAQQTPVSPFLILAIVGFAGAAFLTGFATVTHTLPTLRPTRWRLQSCTAACAAAMGFTNIIALKHLPLTLFYDFFFTAPLVIALFSVFLKHETLTPTKIACLIAGFIGTIGVHGGNGDMTGYIAISVSIICYSSRPLFVRHMGKTVTAESTLILCTLFVSLAGVAGFLLQPSVGGIETWAFFVFAFCGILTTLGSILYFHALQNTLSTNVIQLHYTQIIFGALFGYLLWNEIPTWNLVVGSFIIIASGMFVAAQARKAEKTAEYKFSFWTEAKALPSETIAGYD